MKAFVGNCCNRFVSVALTFACVSTAHAQDSVTWGERLGFGADKKVVILESAQFGMCHEANTAIEAGLSHGLLTSASAMVPCPWFSDAAGRARNQPNADVGVALTLTTDWDHYQWRPVSPRTSIDSLVDADGFFWRTPFQFASHAHVNDVRRELLAQLRAARMAGIVPSHLTSHQGTLVMRPELLEVYLDIAEKHWIPAVVVELRPAHIERFREQGFPIDERTLELLASYSLPKVDDLKFCPIASTYEEKKAMFLDLLNSLVPGISVVHVMPANESEAIKQMAGDWQQRVWESQLLTDSEVSKGLESAGVLRVTWREIMQRFEGEAPSENTESEHAEPANRDDAKLSTGER